MNKITQKQNRVLALIDILVKNIQTRKLETDQEVLAFHHIMSFLFTERKKEEQNNIRLEILNEIIVKQLFYSYQAIQSILEEPIENLSKMIPFIYCFREYLEQKGLENACDEEKINLLKKALLLPKENSTCRSKTLIFLSNEKK